MSMSPAKPSRRSTRIRTARSTGTIGRPTASGSPGRVRRRTELPKVYLFSVADKKTDAGDGRLVFGSTMSTFSDDGKYLMLTSSRDFKPIFGAGRFRECLSRSSSAFISSRSPRIPKPPLGPRSDEVGKKKDRRKKDGKKDADKKADDKKAATRKPTTRRRRRQG